MLEEEDHKKKIILASASPRRREILKLLKLDFEVIEPEGYEEKQLRNPYRTVTYNSINKARNVYNYIKEYGSRSKKPDGAEQFLIAGFDTIISLGRRYLGKPADNGEAIEFLNILSGKVHRVISGVCVLDSISGKFYSDTESTRVKFRKLTTKEIERYIDKEDALDKAGAYNIFGRGSLLVEKIDGCFYNVAGLPVVKFANLLKKFEFKVIGKLRS